LAFENRILTGAAINVDYIEPRQFLENAGCVVLERVRDIIERHNGVKVNIVFNGEFVAGDKRANKSINTRNYELFRISNLREWYERHRTHVGSPQSFKNVMADGCCREFSILR